MARQLTEIETMEMEFSFRMGFRVELLKTTSPQLILARFNHPTGIVQKFLDREMLPELLTQVCAEIIRYTQ